MSEYSIIDFLKSLSDSILEKDIVESLFTDIDEEELLNKFLELLKENKEYVKIWLFNKESNRRKWFTRI